MKTNYGTASLDRIDDLFAEYYEFTNEEKDFIKDFDVGFRMGK